MATAAAGASPEAMPTAFTRLLRVMILLAVAPTLARAAFTLPLHEQAAWRLDNGRGFGNVSLEGFSLPAAALQLLHRKGIVGDPLYRWEGLLLPCAEEKKVQRAPTASALPTSCPVPDGMRCPHLRSPMHGRYNELEQRWTAWDNWTFSLEFEAPPELLAEAAVELVCEGLDTGGHGRPTCTGVLAPFGRAFVLVVADWEGWRMLVGDQCTKVIPCTCNHLQCTISFPLHCAR